MHRLEKYQICIDCSGIWAVLRIPKHDIPLDFSRYRENHLIFLNRVFRDLCQIPVIKYDPAGDTWPWTWVTGEAGKPRNSWCVSFETECRFSFLSLYGLIRYTVLVKSFAHFVLWLFLWPRSTRPSWELPVRGDKWYYVNFKFKCLRNFGVTEKRMNMLNLSLFEE